MNRQRWPTIVRSFAAFMVAVVMATPGAEPRNRRKETGPRGTPVLPTFHSEVPGHPGSIILGRPTDTRITVSLLLHAATEGILVWGTRAEALPVEGRGVSLKAGEPQHITLDGLTPNTRYFYELRDAATSLRLLPTPGMGTFHTARPPGAGFSFTVTADSHLDENTSPGLYLQTIRNSAADRPDFHIDLGDTFMAGKFGASHGDALPQYLAQRWYFGQLCAQAPLFLVLGNHDGETAGRVTDAVRLRTRLFPNPLPDDFYTGNARPLPGLGGLPQDYYAWTWGSALFVVLDPFLHTEERPGPRSNGNWGRTLGLEQYDWLKATLEASRAQYRFVFIHHLVGGLDRNARGGVEAAGLYEWGGHDPNHADAFARYRPGWPLPIHDLLVRQGVQVVFHGHDHFFARQERDGIVYQLVPQPGHPGGDRLPRFASEYGYREGTLLGGAGHLRVRVGPYEAIVDYLLAATDAAGAAAPENGRVAFSYTLAPRAPRH